ALDRCPLIPVLDLLAGRGVPQTDCLVPSSGSQGLAVGRKAYRQDRQLMAHERANFLAVEIPQMDRQLAAAFIKSSRCQRLAVGRNGQRINPAGVSAQTNRAQPEQGTRWERIAIAVESLLPVW